MLKLQDFVHLPQLDDLLGQLLADEPSLVVVAGLDPRQVAGDAFLPSGRAAIWGILWREFLAAHPRSRAIIVAGDRAAARISRRISRPLRRRVQVSLVGPAATYAQQIADTARRRPDLLVIDRLCPESLPGALYAAHDGVRVLSQLDTVFRGAA
ncbi:MAG: hypothetical protein KJ734_00675, partial [Chloroflexi bacterium]|nr:hypothetical protein [Chloroflexota bacterium]